MLISLETHDNVVRATKLLLLRRSNGKNIRTESDTKFTPILNPNLAFLVRKFTKSTYVLLIYKLQNQFRTRFKLLEFHKISILPVSIRDERKLYPLIHSTPTCVYLPSTVQYR